MHKTFMSKAVDLILKPSSNDDCTGVREACEVWSNTRNASEAVKSLKRSTTTEAIILQTLAKQGSTAFVNALQKVRYSRLRSNSIFN